MNNLEALRASTARTIHDALAAVSSPSASEAFARLNDLSRFTASHVAELSAQFNSVAALHAQLEAGGALGLQAMLARQFAEVRPTIDLLREQATPMPLQPGYLRLMGNSLPRASSLDVLSRGSPLSSALVDEIADRVAERLDEKLDERLGPEPEDDSPRLKIGFKRED
jgi:hypothetical protein